MFRGLNANPVFDVEMKKGLDKSINSEEYEN